MGEQALLLKFGKREHVLQLREEGLLYMNNLPYFWRLEDRELRGDPFDSVDQIERGRKGIALPDSTELPPIKVTNWTIRILPFEPEKINIFCMYALRPSAGTFPVDARNFQFGDYALVVTNVPQFLDRISSCLERQGVRGEADLVKYVDNKHIGKVGPFRKLKFFAYQSEWRLVCYDGPGKARRVRIGGIKDISIVMRSKEVNCKIRIYPNPPL